MNLTENKEATEEIKTCCPDPEQGLTHKQAQQRLDCGLGNRVSNIQNRTEGQIILHNCLTFFNLVFLVLAFLLILVGSSAIKLTFLVVVFINAIIGCIQEIRAKRAVDKLTLVAAQTVKTLRNGSFLPLPSQEVVRDDIVEFSSGDQICADGVLRTGYLQVNESLVTGEADAVSKKPGDALKSGSFVVAGRGRVQLTDVGDAAFAARLAAEAKKNPNVAKSEMMRSLDKLIKVIGIALIPMGLLLFFQELLILKLGLQTSAEATVAALVGMIPEGLYLLTSIALAVSAIKLSRQKVLVQDMNCIETLARVDVLCVDKTGTITEPSMEVENVLPLTNDPPELLEAAMTALYGGSEPENDTGRALRELFHGKSDWVCTDYIPFTSQTKWCAGVYEGQGAFLAGAPEIIMGIRYAELKPQVQQWSASGYRVLLAAAYDGMPKAGQLDSDKVRPLALILLTNRIRNSARETFTYFAQQGVTIKVISGDNPDTVSAVAARAGIANADRCVDATELETKEAFLEAVEKYTVFGRVTPDKKRELIRALKEQRHTVAMTGDGVNDVLAMKEADCGIAMASGAQAACQVARLVLLNSDFAAMPGIVGEGRRVINNIQRAATLFLVKNIFSLGTALLCMITGWAYPLEPQHMSIISGLTIGLPSFFLAMEPNYERVRGRFLTGVLRRAFPGGLTNILVILAAQAFMAAFSLPLEQISTISTAVLSAVGMLVLVQVCKPFDKFRKLVVAAVGVLLLGCFIFLGDLFELYIRTPEAVLVLVTLLMMTPTVFYIMQRIFDWGNHIYDKIKVKFAKK
ncbi:MAG: HAD-IC family P-type ATPase [Oscillospiraceae bacterium]|nr:HAD-IC family P-type ATPase [Oscillospiraceae bacterium]